MDYFCDICHRLAESGTFGWGRMICNTCMDKLVFENLSDKDKDSVCDMKMEMDEFFCR